MRRAMILVIAIMAVLIAIPTGANARRDFFSTLTSPMRFIARGVFGRRMVRRRRRYRWVAVRRRRMVRRHRRAVARRSVPAASIAVPAVAATTPTDAAPTPQAAPAAEAPATTAPAAAPTAQESTAAPTPRRSRSVAAAPQSTTPPARAAERRPPDALSAEPSGWAGALYWPQASDDLFTYVFRPAVGGDRFWARGGHDLADGIFMRDPNPPSDWTATCGGEQSGSVWSEAITRAVQPTAAQRAALDDLTTALAKADESIRGTCPAAPATPTPTQRLAAMTDRVWSMRQAVVLMRAPLEKFVATLDEPQKARFNEMSAQAQRRETPDSSAPPTASANACANPAAATIAWPGERLERRVRPGPGQRESLQRLQTTTQDMGNLLMASCPSKPAATPLARLEAAEKRLDAMLYAARVVGPALHGFYDQLNAQQRAAFNALGSDPRAASPVARGGR